MAGVKDIRLAAIPSKEANAFVRSHHYSGKVVSNSQLHLGAFLGGRLHGVMSFGPSTDKRKMIGLVEGTGWNEFIELNRMAFDEALPRNSESRSLSVAMRLLRKNAPHLKWVVSFADGCSCGDGTIYRASGFVLTQIKRNTRMLALPDGTKIHVLTLQSSPNAPRPELGGLSYNDLRKHAAGGGIMAEYMRRTGAVQAQGFMLRYVYFLDPSYRARLTVPEVPFSSIAQEGAGMYRGTPRGSIPSADVVQQ